MTHNSAMELVLSREAVSIEKTGHTSAVSEENAMIDELFMFGLYHDYKSIFEILTQPLSQS